MQFLLHQPLPLQPMKAGIAAMRWHWVCAVCCWHCIRFSLRNTFRAYFSFLSLQSSAKSLRASSSFCCALRISARIFGNLSDPANAQTITEGVTRTRVCEKIWTIDTPMYAGILKGDRCAIRLFAQSWTRDRRRFMLCQLQLHRRPQQTSRHGLK
jgi:hypothetical protein